MKRSLVFSLVIFFLTIFSRNVEAQSCSPAGDELSYGTNNTWIGYVYGYTDFIDYRGYVTEGSPASADFAENFGGDTAVYPTNGCSIVTNNFSVRYKLTKTFIDDNYEFEVSADDAFRFSIDGGATWLIDEWDVFPLNKLKYAVTRLSGTYNLVLEYYEWGRRNTVSFNVRPTCLSTANDALYGTNNIWKGYVYRGFNFDLLKGVIGEGTSTNPSFDENFGNETIFNTGTCPIKTDTFMVRYRLQKTFAPRTYIFTVGGDDGYRLSLDGGATWIIDNWDWHGYQLTTYALPLNGTYNMVIEYFEDKGGNRISFSVSDEALPIKLLAFNGKVTSGTAILNWSTISNSTTDHFVVEKSADGKQFGEAGIVNASQGFNNLNKINYTFTHKPGPQSMWFYRLKMVDISGDITYSQVIQLSFSNSAGGIQIYPTVSAGNITISTKEEINSSVLLLYDCSGRQLFSQQLGTLMTNSSQTLQLPGYLKTGVYLVRISGQKFISDTKKIIIQK